MPKKLILIALLMMVPFYGIAGEVLNSKSSLLIDELYDLTDHPELADKIIAINKKNILPSLESILIGSQLEGDNKVMQLAEKEIEALVLEKISDGSSLKKINREIFIDVFSESELEDILKFVSTAHGKKFVVNFTRYRERIADARLAWATRDLPEEIKLRIVERLKLYAQESGKEWDYP